MATVINDLTIEPKTASAAADAVRDANAGGGRKAGPELERELDKVRCREHDRALRTWAH
jgi:hypothetical protein